jgi:uncharacterized protein with von Willebrand factor type A (vWA) domain
VTDTLPPLLLGLFRELKANGVPVGTRDYLDGVEALRLGFGQGDRAALRDLASALWGRSDEERRLIGRWFDVLPPPDGALIATIDDELDARDATTDQAIASPAAATARPAAPTPAGGGPVLGAAPGATVDTSAAQAARARVSFAATREGSGLPIPRLASAPQIGEDYVLNPQPLISPRDMAVLWRRYRRSTRHGPRTEMDLAATLRERCRRGLLCRPVCRPRRSNSARLLILADASPSMDPWRPLPRHPRRLPAPGPAGPGRAALLQQPAPPAALCHPKPRRTRRPGRSAAPPCRCRPAGGERRRQRPRRPQPPPRPADRRLPR